MGASDSVESIPIIASSTPPTLHPPEALCQSNTVETNSLIWLDAELKNNNTNWHAQQQLRNIINNIKTFADPHECQQYIQQVPMNHRIILIVSGRLGQEIVPYIHHLKQITSIYVYCADKQKNEKWTQKYNKIKAVIVQFDDLLHRIQQALRHPVEFDESMSMNIFIDDPSTTGLNGQYVHFILLFNILIRIKPNANDKRELIVLCKQKYRGNEGHISLINVFEQHYSPERALEWYTRESFLYQTLNTALRKQDIDMLYLFRWFIADIRLQLVLYQCQRPIRVYRGQLMSTNEVEHLKKSIGKLISFNSFLSASLNEWQAIHFQKSDKSMNGLQRVLFDINADPQVATNKPFADVSSHSDFASEREVLFMFGSVFRITDVCNRGNGQEWIIHMTLCDDSNHHLSQLMDHMEVENENFQPNLASFGLVLWKMGKYELAEKYLRRRLSEISVSDPTLGSVYLHLGLVIAEKEDYVGSLWCYDKALTFYMQADTSNYVTIGLLHNNIGEIHRRRRDYTQAMTSYMKAMSLFEEAQDENHLNMAMIYNNIGLIHYSQGDYAEALCFYEKSRAISQQHRHPRHSDIGLAYSNIGVVHLSLNKLDLALEYFERTIEIYMESLPSTHPDLGWTYHNIGRVYEKKNELLRAWQNVKKALEIRQHALPLEHPAVIESQQTLQRIAVRLSSEIIPHYKQPTMTIIK